MKSIIKTCYLFLKDVQKNIYISYHRLLLKIYGAKVGSNCCIYKRTSITVSQDAQMSIGNDFLMLSGRGTNPLSRNLEGSLFLARNAKLDIGDNVGLSSVCIEAHTHIKIGNNVKIGACSVVLDSNSHSLDYMDRRLPDTDKPKESPIYIEDDVWIGMNCLILKGVTIGAKSIIASGSVVTKSIPPNCIAGGTPCKVIKYINS